MTCLLSNVELLSEFNKYVKGHLQAKKILINLINRSKRRHYQKWVSLVKKEDLIEPSKCLLIGASGTGKTLLVDTLQKLIKFPLIKLDATNLTITSAGDGLKVDDVIKMVKNRAKELALDGSGYYNSQEALIDQTVIFIDEIDKLAWGEKGGNDWNKRTQSNFLRLIENRDELAGVSFIFAGAFSNMKESLKSLNSSPLGFISKKEKVGNDSHLLEDLIIKYGLIPEFVGRINSIVELDSFTKTDYFEILEEILIPKKLKDHVYKNAEAFSITQKQREDIVNMACNSGQGVRFLKRELEKLFIDYEFEHGDFRHVLEDGKHIMNEEERYLFNYGTPSYK